MNGISFFNLEVELANSPISKNECCLVLESDPNPDYYAKNYFPPNKHISKWHLYFITQSISDKTRLNIYRNIPKFIELFGSNIETSFGSIMIQNKEYNFVRIMTDNLEHIHSYHLELEKLGIKFINDRKLQAGKWDVAYSRFVEYEKIEEGAYKEKSENGRIYFSVPNALNKTELSELIRKIKGQCGFDFFDAYTVSLPKAEGLDDFIGIYSNHCDQNRIHEFRLALNENLGIQ